MLTVIIPAHNEENQIGETLDSVFGQTTPPDWCVVITNNCSDDDRTGAIARAKGADVFDIPHCEGKKAGALNAWLDYYLDSFEPDDMIMVMDADSTLDKEFLTNAIGYIKKGYGACGGVFSGKPGGGFVGMLQRNEYARYERDVARKDGKTLVLTGTATLFTVGCLQSVVAARRQGVIPRRTKQSPITPRKDVHVYDTKVLTEDNELTFALLHLGYKIIAPASCKLQTEVMETWRALWQQRHRWKRGAIENNAQYGLTRYTAKYWGLQIWGIIGILATIAYLTTTIYALAFGQLHIYIVWMIVSAIYIAERVVTVHSRGWKQSVLAGLLFVEMIFDLFLQAVHLKALLDAMRRAEKAW